MKFKSCSVWLRLISNGNDQIMEQAENKQNYSVEKSGRGKG